jgi:hypothetical protein
VLHMASEELNGALSLLTDGIVKGIISTAVSVLDVCAIVNKILDSLKVAFGGGDSESCTTIVVVGIDSPALKLEDIHILDIVLKGCVVESVLIIANVLQTDVTVFLLSSTYGTMLKENVLDRISLSIIQWSRSPSIFWINIHSYLKEELYDL